jgi:hypothetical protein
MADEADRAQALEEWTREAMIQSARSAPFVRASPASASAAATTARALSAGNAPRAGTDATNSHGGAEAMGTPFHCTIATSRQEAASNTGDQQRYASARDGCMSLERAINAAIARQARAWGIRSDQARSLLMDWKAVA